MAHSRLIKQYINIFDTQQLDELHDILVDAFYFKSPNIEIIGKNQYIEYVKDTNSVFTTDIVDLYAKDNGLYIHEYIVTMYDSKIKLNDQVHVVEQVQISNGLVASSIIDYKTDGLSESAANLLKKTAMKHGVSAKY